MDLIARNNQVVQVWKVRYLHNYFEWPLFVSGTEDEMREYLDSEVGYVGSYRALTDQEVSAVKVLGLKIYIAPQL